VACPHTAQAAAAFLARYRVPTIELRVGFLAALGTILLFGLGCRGPLFDTVLSGSLDFGSETAALFFGLAPFGFSLARYFFLIALHLTGLPARQREQHWIRGGGRPLQSAPRIA
jgi:hypothetical protein